MKARMLCTECLRTAEADTVLEGSDAIEMLGWCCFVWPGLLYCWWRHALRIKLCGFCGSRELVREARAAAARRPAQAPSVGGARVRSEFAPLDWPTALACPRDRLRVGGSLLLLAVMFSASAALDVAVADDALILLHAVVAAAAAWVLRREIRVAKLRAALSDCRAWHADGREIQIERIV